ncbi:MAG: hypothetical protein IJ905_06685 [Fibrobacter sp.]|nr:hypothetical protein [Fibrobacter sp.]
MSFSILPESIKDESLNEDLVAKEFDTLDSEVRSFTEGRASVIFVPMSDDDSRVYFKEKKDVECYWVDLKYVLKDDKGQEHRYRNRFAYISYNATFPVAFGSPLQEDKEVRVFSHQEELQSALKEVVSEKSFVRSILRAKSGTVSST